jgi:hypothetical protein
VDLGPLVGVALEANGGLPAAHHRRVRSAVLDHDRVFENVDRVATRAGDFRRRVHAALPVDPLAALVAAEAGFVLRTGGEVSAEADRGAHVLVLDVRRARSVAGLTLVLLREWCPSVRLHRVLGCQDREHGRFCVLVVAAEAVVHFFLGVGFRLFRRCRTGQSEPHRDCYDQQARDASTSCHGSHDLFLVVSCMQFPGPALASGPKALSQSIGWGAF